MVLLPLPFIVTSLLDVLGWRQVLPRQPRVPVSSLLTFHMGAEAVLQSFPGGFALSDAVKTLLLKRRFDVLPYETLGSLVIRHWMIGLAQILYIIGALSVGFVSARHLVAAVFDQKTAFWAGIGLLFVFSFVLGLAVRSLANGTLASRIWRLFWQLPIRSLRGWLKVRQASFHNADAHLKMLANKGRRTLLSMLGLYLIIWLMDTVETLLVAKIIGFPLGVADAFILEALLSALKLAVFFLPSGIGAKDLGYFALFATFGVSATTIQIGSFVVLKRAVFLFWVALGYLILLSLGVRPMSRLADPESSVVKVQ